MTSATFAFYLTCLFLGEMAQVTEVKLLSSVHQESGFLSVKAGDKLTLQCFYEGDASTWLYWFKQTLGQKPRLISSFYMYGKNATLYGEFKSNQRFTLDTGNGKNHLKISDFQISDSATYYCAKHDSFELEFAEGASVGVDFEDEVNSPVLVYFLSGALAFTTILVVLLTVSMYKMNKRNSCQSSDSQARLPASFEANSEGHRDADNLHYTALSVNLPNRSRRQRNSTNNECVYSSVKQ